MNRRAALLLVLLAGIACRRAPAPPPPAKPAPAADEERNPLAAAIEDIDGDNLLNLAYGASVVSRTGELNLVNSAAQAIDGMSFTVWSSSPGEPGQTLIFSLGAPSRVEHLGVTTTAKLQSPAQVRFEASSDARAWREVATLEPDAKGTKMVDVKPFDARYLRITTSEPSEFYATFASIHALGRETAPPTRQSFDGCWTINNEPARLIQRGARVTGVLGGAKPTWIDGGMDGRVAKLLWMRGPMWGFATATLTPDGRGLTAITFHEDPTPNRGGESWFGTRCDGAAAANALPPPASPASYLRRIGYWTMAGIVFDAEERLMEEPSRAALDEAVALLAAAPSQRFRVIAHEFRNNDAKENRRRTAARVDAIRNALRARGVDVSRIEFIGKGSEAEPIEMPSAIQRMLWSRIELEKIR